MTEPIFTIIIPVRSPTIYLKETLKHLQGQSYPNFEIIVATDKLTRTSHPAAKRNWAAKKAKGRYLAFLDDDSYPDSNWLKNALKILDDFPQAAAVCGPSLTPPSDNIRQRASGMIWGCWLGSGGAGSYRNRIAASRPVDDFPTVNLIVRRADFNKVGGFNLHYWPGEDTILCHDLTHKLNKKIIYHPSIIVYHHRRPAIISHLQQIGRYALHRGHFAKVFPATSRRLGYLTPALFLTYLLILIPINILIGTIFILNLPLYLYLSILIVTFFGLLLESRQIRLSLLAAVTIPLTHIYYGSLFIIGFFSHRLSFKPHEIDPKTKAYIGG